MNVNKYGLVNVLKVNYELSKNDPNFKVGLDKLLKELLWYIGERLDDDGEFKKGVNRHVRQKYWSKDAVLVTRYTSSYDFYNSSYSFSI